MSPRPTSANGDGLTGGVHHLCEPKSLSQISWVQSFADALRLASLSWPRAAPRELWPSLGVYAPIRGGDSSFWGCVVALRNPVFQNLASAV